MTSPTHINATLRDFQLAAVDGTFACWDRGITSVVNVVPTGGGKTMIAAELHARHEGSPSLFIVPRDELMDQAMHKFRSLICGKSVETLARLGTLQKQAKAWRLKQIMGAGVVVAMVQSLVNVLPEIPRNHFGMIGTDECHHGVAASYTKIFRHFAPGAHRQYGLTATPERSDGIGLFNTYQEVAYEMSLIQAVNAGWLVWPEQQNVPIQQFDIRNVPLSGRELHGAQLLKILSREGLLESVIDHTMNIADGRKVAFYCHRKQVSRQVHEILNRRGVTNYYIDESTPKGFRKNAIGDFSRQGGCNVLSSVNALAEGFDCPLLEVIGFLCPTASVGTFKQKFGRLTRPFLPPQELTPDGRLSELQQQGKRALFLDFVGATGKHVLMSSADALGMSLTEEERRAVKRIADTANGPVDMRQVIMQAQQQVAETRRGRTTPHHAEIELNHDHEILKSYIPHPFDVLSLDRSMAAAIPENEPSVAAWELLSEHGLRMDERNRMTSQEAILLSRVLNSRRDEHLCSYRQAVTLHKCGYDPRRTTFSAACGQMNAIRLNDWQRLPDDGENIVLKRLKGQAACQS